jgi:hypothetical protein
MAHSHSCKLDGIVQQTELFPPPSLILTFFLGFLVFNLSRFVFVPRQAAGYLLSYLSFNSSDDSETEVTFVGSD